jgi:hypothetical protein|nr:MAG TPA: hypothetical protein [Caudoviricetes sp.]
MFTRKPEMDKDTLGHLMRCRLIWQEARQDRRVVVVSSSDDPFKNYREMMDLYIRRGLIKVVNLDDLTEEDLEGTVVEL